MNQFEERALRLRAERAELRARLATIEADLAEPSEPPLELYRAVFDTTYQFTLVFDMEGRVVDVNRAALVTSGRTIDELRGRTFVDVPSRLPELAKRMHENVMRVLRERTPVQDEASMTRPQGGPPITMLSTYRPLILGGEMRGVIVESLDVTSQRTAEASIAESEAQLRSILDEIEVGVLSLSADGQRLLYANPALERIVGRPQQEFSTPPVSLLPWVHPDDKQRAAEARLARLRGEPGALELRIIRPDGETRWIRFSANAVRGPDGAMRRVDMIVVDRTEQRRAEEALRRSERRFRSIVARGWDMIALLDASGNFMFLSDSVERILGFTIDDYQRITGRPRRAPPPSPELVAAWPEVLREPGCARFFESQVPTKDGRHRWLETLVQNLLDDPDVGAIVASSHDITVRKEAEQALAHVNAALHQRVQEATAELQLSNAALARALRIKDEFLANMSHELRTPLNGVLGLVEALQENVYGPISDKQRTTLGRIEQSGRHLLSLISDILDLSKIEAGKETLELTHVTLGEVCRASLSLVEGAARQKRIRVFVQLADGFASCTADERKLKQILVNLLGNALKFTPEGGEAGLEVSVDPADDTVCFAVWDRGIGIAAESLPRLFQPFVQLESSLSRSHTGSGLGLALVKRLVEMHEGTIDVESTLGQGSRFTVRLPLKRRSEPTPANGMRRALVVEDSGPVAEQIARYLAEIGLDALPHDDPRTVIERAATEQPAMVLLDILLPAAVGWQILRELRADRRTAHIPVIVVTVLDRREQALALGAVDLLRKPVTREALHAIIRRIDGSDRRVPSPVLVVGASTAPVDTRARTILVAEDDETNIVTLADFLRVRGYEVFVARNGREAIDLAREIRPNAILMDIQMPVLDGLQAIRVLKADPSPEIRTIPVVALTALTMAGDRERCLESGADEYMPKPISLRQLSIVLTELIGNHVPH